MLYFSEREFGEQPPMNDEIGKAAWDGIKAYVDARVTDGSFGGSYPQHCPDGNMLIGTDKDGFEKALKSIVPNLSEYPHIYGVPQTFDILDMIEFCWRNIAHPTTSDNCHSYFRHYHLRFLEHAKEDGQKEFRGEINDILRRNSISYILTEEGKIERTPYTVLKEELASAYFSTKDPELNSMLEKARQKFFDPREETHREALEVLWDAWERLKTLDNSDIKAGITAILDDTAGSGSSKFRGYLEQEALELRSIGNNLHIRHSNSGQEKVSKAEHIDYLFHRLFSLIQMILRARK